MREGPGESAGLKPGETPPPKNKGLQPRHTPHPKERIERERTKPAFVSGHGFSRAKNNRAEGASLLPQAVGGSAAALEPTRPNFPFREGTPPDKLIP